jgi:hypothetical protein
MKTLKPAVHNTAFLETRRRWPLKADYLDVPREKAVAFIEKFVTHFGFGYLRERGAFQHMSLIQPAGFGPHDLYEALKVVVATVNARRWVDTEAQSFKKSLEQEFGPSTGHIAVRLCGWGFIIAPKAELQ